MADDKIKVSWDELNTTKVDNNIKHQEMLRRTQEHQQHIAVAPPPVSTDNKQSILYNTILYMALFGLVGGMLAWGFGEIVYTFKRNDYSNYQKDINFFQRKMKTGELSNAQLEKLIRSLAKKNKYWAIWIDSSLSKSAQEIMLNNYENQDNFVGDIIFILYLCILGVFLATFLSIAEPVMSRNWRQVFINASIASIVGILGGCILFLFAGRIYLGLLGDQSTLSGGVSMVRQMFARAVSWSIVGFFLAIAPGLIYKNFKKLLTGILGGLLGGLVGGLLFDPIGMLTNSGIISRFVQLIAIGVTAGVGIGLFENALKTGWLKVTAGLIAGKQFIIYRNPTRIGSSPECEIYLFKDRSVAPFHAAIKIVPSGFVLEDSGSPTGTYVNGKAEHYRKLKSNDQLQIGGTTFVFQGKAQG